MKIAKKIINIFFVIFIILIIVINMYILYNRVVQKKDVIKINGYSTFIVISGSMEPTINVDDLIIIKEENEYKEQDIVTYQSNKSVVTHRIVKKEGDIIWTKGDNNNTEDSPINSSQIYGKYIYKIKNVGKIIQIINSPIGIAIFLSMMYFSIRELYTKERR